MSFGIGIGDIFAVSRLAWTVYKSCKGAPESFGHVSSDVHSLKAVLDETEEVIAPRPLSPNQQERLVAILSSCHGILTELQKLVDKYHSLAMQSKRTWDRCRWYSEDIADIRSRLVAQVAMLDAYLSTSQVRVEMKLDQLLKEFREGRRGGSAISVQTVESLSIDEKQAWREIRKELEDVGITIAAFNANKDFILQWLVQAAESGAFEERPPEELAERVSLPKEVPIGSHTAVTPAKYSRNLAEASEHTSLEQAGSRLDDDSRQLGEDSPVQTSQDLQFQRNEDKSVQADRSATHKSARPEMRDVKASRLWKLTDAILSPRNRLI